MVGRRRPEMFLLGPCLLLCLLNSVSSQPCPDGWRRNQQSCYLLVDTQKTWRDARDECHLLQADLASLTTTDEQTWMGSQVSATYWFGLSDIVAEDGWQWADGTDYDPSVTNWGQNEPNNQNGEDCAEIMSSGRWNDQACTDMHGYICERRTGLATTCRGGWQLRNGRCYYFSNNQPKLSWLDAQKECERRNANLVSITNLDEQAYVAEKSLSVRPDGVWIGLSNVNSPAPDQPQWSNGMDNFTYDRFTTGGQPNWQWPGATCVLSLNDGGGGRWETRRCGLENRYICETGTAGSCPAGWRNFGNKCYQFSVQSVGPWIEARQDCELHGARLATIHNQNQQNFINSMFPSLQAAGVSDLWIGLSDMGDDGVWHWEDGVRYTNTFQNWFPNNPGPNTVNREDCARVYTGSPTGQWEAVDCWNIHGYVCQIPEGTSLLSGDCYAPLGMEDRFIPDGQISASTELDPQHAAKYGRLGIYDASIVGAAWCPTSTDADPWIEVDLGQPGFRISGIVTQGARTNKWVVSYRLAFRDSPTNDWVNYTDISHRNGIFPANNDEDTRMRNILQEPHVTRFTRVYPVDWAPAGAAIRLELLGCDIKPVTTYCDDGWVIWENYCYLFRTQELTWTQAENRCTQVGGHLASVRTGQENEFIRSHSAARKIWIGLNDRGNEDTWRWTDSTGVGYLNWLNNQPDDAGNTEDCVEMYTNGRWNDNRCNNNNVKRDSVCKKAPNNGSPPPPRTTVGWTSDVCPPDWEDNPLNDFCYQFHTGSFRTWQDARAVCQANGGDLVSINTPSESAYITGRVASVTNMATMWIGAHDQTTEGGWSWVDGSPFNFLNWGGGEPNNAGNGGEDCTEIAVTTGNWNDLNCDNLRGYICEMRANVPTPTPVPDQPDEHVLHICERNSDTISCLGDEVIQVVSANYGRTDSNACADSPISVVDCLSPTALLTVQSICDNQQSCTLDATNAVFGDPCPGTYKYIEILYRCTLSVCLVPMGMEAGTIADYQLSASSNNQYAGRARLNYISRDNNPGGWVPLSGDGQPWIQVDFRASKKVTGVITQGRQDADQWVKTFTVQFSDDGVSYRTYKGIDGNDKIFTANTDRSSSVSNSLANANSILTRYLRIAPIAYQGSASLRFEVLGCDPANIATCLSSGKDLAASIGEQYYTVHCPPGCASQSYFVWGTGTYADDSFVCASAVHDGRITDANGGEVTVLMQAGESAYVGSTMNGVTTQNFGADDASFTFNMNGLRCPTGWTSFGDNCYRLYDGGADDVKSWRRSSQSCGLQGAELASIANQAEQNFVYSLIQPASMNNVWLGLNDRDVQMFFQWSDGTPVTFTLWNDNEPNNYQGRDEDCVNMYKNNGLWNDAQCDSHYPYVCEIPKQSLPEPTVLPTVAGCEQGWLGYENSCYIFNNIPAVFQDARRSCRSLGADLVAVTDRFEQAFLSAQLGNRDGNYWIGLRGTRDDDTGVVVYQWRNGEPLSFTNWDRLQPSFNWGACVSMTAGLRGGLWDDNRCVETFPYICEKLRSGYTPPPGVTHASTARCPRGWLTQTGVNYCYQINQVDEPYRKTWEEARAHCQSQGADLVSLHRNAEMALLTNQVNSAWMAFWIGLNDKDDEGGFKWSDGRAVGYTEWNDGEPNNAGDSEHCVELVAAGSDSFWNDLSCTSYRNWICMVSRGDSVLIPTTPPSVPENAPICSGTTDWKLYSGHCYYVSDSSLLSWQESRAYCRSTGGDLASINDMQESRFLIGQTYGSLSSHLWIGLREYGVDGVYTWSDGSAYSYLNWVANEPNNAGGAEQCAEFYPNNGRWNDANCGTSNGFICERPLNPLQPPQPTQPLPGNCPAGWKTYRNKCYRFYLSDDTEKTWRDARDFCRSLGSNDNYNLVAIENEYEQAYIMSQLKGIRRTVWIGLFDNIDENQFYWTSGHPVTFTNWNDGEPNNWNSQDEDCVDMYTDQARAGLWNDAPCDHLRLFICQSYKDPSLPAQPDISTCPSGFVAWRDSCYKLTQTAQSWAQANDACSREGTGAQVVSIYDIYEQSFVKSQFVQQAWIGLSDQQVAGEYRWFSGWPVHFTAWGFNEPSRADGEGCVAMAMNGTWDDTDCSLQLPALCEITTATPPPTAPPMFGRCPDDTWLAIGSYCFYVEYGLSNTDQTRKTWYEAEFECVSRGAHLASFHSSEETNAIISRQGTPIWIGMFRDTGGALGWYDGDPVDFTSWGDGEPNNPYSGQCVMMDNDGTWNDVICTRRNGYVCKRDKIPYSAITDNSISPGSVATVQYCQTTAEILFRGNCYRFYDERLEAWAEARSICLLFGGDLASINSGAETQFLVTQVANKNSDLFWIGLREYSFDGLYQWTDGSAYFFHNWSPGEPNDYMGAEQCVEMQKGDGGWNDRNCGDKQGFICKRPYHQLTPPPPTSPWAGGCPNNWLPYGNKCYYVVNNYNLKRNWEDARSYCKSFGQTDFDANLVSIENEYEQAFVTSLLTQRIGMWIGLFDSISENNFFWASGHSVTYTNWNDRQPNGFNNQQGDENCVMLHWESALAGKWNDADCSRQLGFICQKYKDPQLPATTPTPSVQCAPGYRNYANNCYKLISTSQDWNSAAQICRQDATELASVTSPYEQGFLTSWLKQKVWIGLSDRQTAGLYTWSDSWPIYYDNWGEGEPSRGANEGCVAMEMDGLWTDSVCSQQLPAVCKKTFDTPPPTLPPSPGYCMDGWFGVGDKCFFIETGTVSTNRKSFVEAQAECRNKNSASVLTSIHSQHVIDVFKQHHGWGVWIGMYLRSDGTVAWLDSTPLDFSAFREGEPDGDDGCTQLLPNGLWELADCPVRKGYICSMPKLPGTRPPYNPNNPVVISPGPGQISGQTGNKSGGLDAGSVIAILLAIAMVCVLALVGGWCYFKRQGTKSLFSFSEKHPTTVNTGFDNALYDATSGTVTMPESQA
ncbi:uncharacterized protein [Branchiostoma lanceolatum]|uniref:uncharacterized protein n=1 Tax=Branchiostoma lanceolatum TaxID=7740 RepID=UPI00345631BD